MIRHHWEGKALSKKNGIFDEVDRYKTGDCCVGQHAVHVARSIFDSVNVLFNVRDMFVGSAHVEVWKPRAQWFKLIVSQDAGELESTMVICVED